MLNVTVGADSAGKERASGTDTAGSGGIVELSGGTANERAGGEISTRKVRVVAETALRGVSRNADLAVFDITFHLRHTGAVGVKHVGSSTLRADGRRSTGYACRHGGAAGETGSRPSQVVGLPAARTSHTAGGLLAGRTSRDGSAAESAGHWVERCVGVTARRTGETALITISRFGESRSTSLAGGGGGALDAVADAAVEEAGEGVSAGDVAVGAELAESGREADCTVIDVADDGASVCH